MYKRGPYFMLISRNSKFICSRCIANDSFCRGHNLRFSAVHAVAGNAEREQRYFGHRANMISGVSSHKKWLHKQWHKHGDICKWSKYSINQHTYYSGSCYYLKLHSKQNPQVHVGPDHCLRRGHSSVGRALAQCARSPRFKSRWIQQEKFISPFSRG